VEGMGLGSGGPPEEGAPLTLAAMALAHAQAGTRPVCDNPCDEPTPPRCK
jgi:hypothetical protein